MVFSAKRFAFEDLAYDPLVGRESVSASFNRWTNESLETKNTAYTPKKHPANCSLGWRLSNDMRVYLSWLQVGLGHHTRKANRWLVHQICLVTSWSSPFLQPLTSCNTCIYEWQRQVASFKSSNCLPSNWSRDFSSIVSHELGFESDEACLWHARPSYTGSWTSCTKLTSIESRISSGMVKATTALHPTTDDWRDDTEGWGRHLTTWRFHSILNFEPWMSLTDSKLTFSKSNDNIIVHYELWSSILKMDILV